MRYPSVFHFHRSLDTYKVYLFLHVCRNYLQYFGITITISPGIQQKVKMEIVPPTICTCILFHFIYIIIAIYMIDGDSLSHIIPVLKIITTFDWLND